MKNQSKAEKMQFPLEYKSPNQSWQTLQLPKIFIAGSIEGGTALPWQAKVREELKGYPLVLLNPRRDDWMTSSEMKMEDAVFREQVQWELDGLDKADYILMYFDPDTYSPVSLIEFGRHVHSDKLMVGCPQGFWRRGNLEVTCAWHGRELQDSFESLMESVVSRLKTDGIHPTEAG